MEQAAGNGHAAPPHLHHLQRHSVIVPLVPRVGRVAGRHTQRAAARPGTPAGGGAGGCVWGAASGGGAPRSARWGPRHSQGGAGSSGVGVLA